MNEHIDWITIPAGTVILINDWDETLDLYLKKDQPRTVHVPAFRIAKYPITNAQFAGFIEWGGYQERRWWTDDGWEMCVKFGWTAPRDWHDPAWNGADQPVVGVSWYESFAFTQWLTDLTGKPIHLPTDAEWQRAAQGDDGRAYPWGNTWDGRRCHHSVGRDWRKRETTPVHHFDALGSSSYGVCDLAGNVSEWCLTDAKRGSNHPHRLLRGGSWRDDDPVFFRIDRRETMTPHESNRYIGFRVCQTPT